MQCSGETSGTSNDTAADLDDDVTLAKVCLSLSRIRNYTQLDEANDVLWEIWGQASCGAAASTKGLVNVILSGIALFEAALLIETQRLTKVFHLIIKKLAAHLKTLLAKQAQLYIALVTEKVVLLYDYAIKYRDLELNEEMGAHINMIMKSQPRSQFALIKAVARRANVEIFTNVSLMNRAAIDDLLDSEEADSCIAASICFSNAIMFLTAKQFEMSRGLFKRCFETRCSVLGRKHADTARVQFLYGFTLASVSSRTPSEQQGYEPLMTDALQVMHENYSTGLAHIKHGCFKNSFILKKVQFGRRFLIGAFRRKRRL